eukprot:g1220.t1
MTSPKLTLSPSATRTTRAACSSSSRSDTEGSPPASERLKPQLFRRKDPARHFQACVRGDIHELAQWVKSGGDPNARDDEGWALLHHATMHGREECVQLLLRQGARHDMVSIGGHTVLHLASANRHCDVVKRLVEAGARVNVRNAHGNTPLHSAAATGTVDVLEYLLSQSANPDLVNSVGETPDEVCGATSEAIHLVAEARRLKQARIAQRLALVKIHKLWNSGRAEPVIGVITGAGGNGGGATSQAPPASPSFVFNPVGGGGVTTHGLVPLLVKAGDLESGKVTPTMIRIPFKSKLVAAAFGLLSASLAPVMTNAVSTQHSTPRLDFVPVVDKRTIAEEYDLPTPPLTRPPSVEHNDDGVADVVPDTFMILEDDDTRGQEEQHPTEDNMFVRSLTTAVMLVVRFVVGPLHVRTRQGCESGADESLGPRSSLWERAKATARRMFDKAKDTVRDVRERLRGFLFDDPIARTARLLALAKTFEVKDMPCKTAHKRHDSDELFKRDRNRLGGNEDVTGSVEKICSQMAREFPEVGYNQGFDAACKSIFQCVGGNAVAAAQVFPKWAVPVAWLVMNEYDEGKRAIEPAISYAWSIISKHAPPVFGWLSRDPVVGGNTADEMVETIIEHIFFEPLTTCCSRLGLPKRVVDDVIEETIKAGVYGPAVTIFVVMSLLCVAEKQGAESEEVVMMKVPLRAAATTVTSFKALQEQGPISLVEFLDGYREAVADMPSGAASNQSFKEAGTE